jgi:protein-S-isoprenylcysteine O-methyltransferase Ste14
MLSDIMVGSALLICVGAFATTNLHNILVVHRRRTEEESSAEIRRPSGVAVGIAALATFLLFLETVAYILLALTGLADPSSMPLSFGFGLLPSMQSIGLVLTITGYSISIWSVVARGVYAASWEMKRSHRLVTWGPYRYVRHPSYLAYFLMFISMPLIWPNLLALPPVAGIPGYYVVTIREEELLTQRFGNGYAEYQKGTGRFIPRFARAPVQMR